MQPVHGDPGAQAGNPWPCTPGGKAVSCRRAASRVPQTLQLEKGGVNGHTACSLANEHARMKYSLRTALFGVLLAALPIAQAADLLVTNVNGYTLDRQGKLQHFQALLVDHGKVVATGDTAALTRRAGAAKVIDGHGHTLLPGLIDAHGHVLELGYARNQAERRHSLTGRRTGKGQGLRGSAPQCQVDHRQRLEPGDMEAGPLPHGQGTGCGSS
jgi:hypothetical protein